MPRYARTVTYSHGMLEDGSVGVLDPFERDNAAITRHLLGKSSRGAPPGEYANSLMLRAMAAEKQAFLVVVDSRLCADTCSVYVPEQTGRTVIMASWAEEIVPRLRRQRAGELEPGLTLSKTCRHIE